MSTYLSLYYNHLIGNHEATSQFHREVIVAIPFEVVNDNGTPTPSKKDVAKAAEETAAPVEEAVPAAEEVPAEETPAEAAE